MLHTVRDHSRLFDTRDAEPALVNERESSIPS